MIFRPKTEDNEDEDYFNTPHQPEAPKPPKQPSPTPDDPKYYDIDDEWEHLRPASRNWRYWLWILAGAIICAAFVAVYFRWFTPYSTLETQYGYVEKISRRGDLFKTFEGVIIPYKAINDTVEPYTGDIVFSVAEDRVAATLLRLQQANLPARVEIARYHGALPWRGESKVIIVAADTADVTKIYPVTLNHPLIPNGKK